MKKIINGMWDGQLIWRYETAEEVLFNELDKMEADKYEQGDCQKCGEPLNNGEGELCFRCKVAEANV